MRRAASCILLAVTAALAACDRYPAIRFETLAWGASPRTVHAYLDSLGYVIQPRTRWMGMFNERFVKSDSEAIYVAYQHEHLFALSMSIPHARMEYYRTKLRDAYGLPWRKGQQMVVWRTPDASATFVGDTSRYAAGTLSLQSLRYIP